MKELGKFPVHLGLNATAIAQPEFTGAMEWYMEYAQRHAADGAEGRLVAMHHFSESWPSWEMHPAGAELVVCTAGELTLHQEQPDGSVESIALTAGQYAINEPGVWHTADVASSATAIFVTAGLGTQHRER